MRIPTRKDDELVLRLKQLVMRQGAPAGLRFYSPTDMAETSQTPSGGAKNGVSA